MIDRDRPGAVNALAGEPLDAVIEGATGAVGWVLDRSMCSSTGRHWTFVSSMNAYVDTATPGQNTDAALCEPV